MFPKGTIYKSGSSARKGEVRIALPFAKRVAHNFTRGAGAGFLALFIINAYFILGPLIKEEIKYRLTYEQKSYEELYDIDPVEAESVIEVQKEADSWKVNPYFSVVIPKINAASDVIANVDTTNKEEYVEALYNGVAHAKGTYFPGQGKNIFLFAHSTDSPANIARYNAVFYLLRRLEAGDRIIVFFTDEKYIYEVKEKVIAEADDTSWLEAGDKERLILLTCDPPGTTWRRLLVIAEPVK